MDLKRRESYCKFSLKRCKDSIIKKPKTKISSENLFLPDFSLFYQKTIVSPVLFNSF